MNPRRFHIGHHFFGTGNLGDDLMMAGFLRWLGERPIELNCPIIGSVPSQRLRFPQINWLDYTPQAREQSIASSNVWLGLGDTPLQIDVGPWFLDHLHDEMQLCRKYRKPMFFLAVGVNNIEALHHPKARDVLDYAEHIWTRDPLSAQLLSMMCGGHKVTLAADLANLWLAHETFSAPDANSIAYLLHFEDESRFRSATIGELIERLPKEYRHRWLVQEVRELAGSERYLYAQLPEAVRHRLDLRAPNYDSDSARKMMDTWGTSDVMIASRYHGLLVGAWSGCRLVPIKRNDKLHAICNQLQIPGLPNLMNTQIVLRAIDSAVPIPREKLMALARLCESACDSFLNRI